MKLTEGGRLGRPNLCCICERTPEIGTKVIDTERYFDGWPANLQGRRYVCEKCVKEFGKLIKGDVTHAQHQLVVEELVNTTEDLRRLKSKLHELELLSGSLR